MNLEQNIQLIADYSQSKEDVIEYMKKIGVKQQLEELDRQALENILEDFINSQRSSRKRVDFSVNSKQLNTASKLDVTNNADQTDATLDIDQTELVYDRESRDSQSYFVEQRGTVQVYQENLPRSETEQDSIQSYQKFQEEFYATDKLAPEFTYYRTSTNVYGQGDELEQGGKGQVQIQQQFQKNNQNMGQRQQLLQDNKLNTIIEREDEEGNNWNNKKTFMISQDSTNLMRDGSVNLNDISQIQSLDGSDHMLRATKSDFGNDCLENIFKYFDQQTNALNTFNWDDLTSDSIFEQKANLQSNQQTSKNQISKQSENNQLQSSNNYNSQLKESDQKQNPDQIYNERIKNNQNLIQMKCKTIEQNQIGKYIEDNNGKRPYIKITKYQVVDKKILYTIDTNLYNSECNNTMLNKTSLITYHDSKSYPNYLSKSQLTNDNSQSIILQNFETSSVVRSHLDFVRLYRNLTAHYYGYFVPPLPHKFPNTQTESILNTIKHIKGEVQYISKTRHEKIKSQLQQFLDSLMNSKVLRNSKILDDFLKIQEQTYYECVCQRYPSTPDFAKLKNVKSTDLYSKDGVFSFDASKQSSLKEYSVVFKEYNDQVMQKYNQVKEKSKQVIKHMKNTSTSLAELGEVFLDLHRITSEFNEKNKIGANQFLSEQYKECGYFMNNFSQAMKVQHSLISDSIDIPLRYESMISKQFESLNSKINEQMGIYKKKMEKLIKSKSKLFDSQNINYWQIDPKVPFPPEAKTNKSLAFNYILPEQTDKLKQFDNKLSFLLSVLYQESFIYIKSREFNNTKNFNSFLNSNQKVLKNLITQHATCLKKMDENQLKSYNQIMSQIKKDTTHLLEDRTRTIMQHNAYNN